MGYNVWKAALLVIFTTVSVSSAAIPQNNFTLNSQAPGVAKDGKILFFVGQDADSLSEFKTQLLDKNPKFPQPAGVTVYTNLIFGAFLAGMGVNPVDENGQLMPGFNYQTNHRYDFGGGPQSIPQTMAEYPGAALNIGLFISDTFAGCSNQPLRAIHGIENPPMGEDINPGLIQAYKNAIDVMVNTMKSWDRQIYLRIGYEFDGSWNCYGSEVYKNAFQYISKQFKEAGAKNVALVWQSSSWPRDEQPHHPEYNFIVTAEDHLEKWYPGDEYVDWIGLSTFFGSNYEDSQWSCSNLNPEFYSASMAPTDVHNRVLEFARKRNKPAMIAEAAPQGMQTDALTKSCIFYRDEKPVVKSDNQKILAYKLWFSWYKEWFGFIKENKDVIRAVSYINADWDTIPQFYCAEKVMSGTEGCSAGYWGDSRIQNNEVLIRHFQRALRAPHWHRAED